MNIISIENFDSMWKKMTSEITEDCGEDFTTLSDSAQNILVNEYVVSHPEIVEGVLGCFIEDEKERKK